MRAIRCIELYKKCYAIASVVSNCALPIERRARGIDNIAHGYKHFT